MTTADSTALIAAAQQRAHDTRHRAVEALRRLDAAGETITFISVARAAGVSRSWLYRQSDLRTEIDRLRTRGTATPIPSAQRASTESQRRRLEATLDEIQRLKAENHQLRQQVAERYGRRRADGLT
jgi:AraC-like DNA-binding protein